jgi:hypothetical protein
MDLYFPAHCHKPTLSGRLLDSPFALKIICFRLKLAMAHNVGQVAAGASIGKKIRQLLRRS